MSVSNRELIEFFLQLENELQASGLDVADYLPVIRSYIYFSQRSTFDTRLVSKNNFSRLSSSFNLFGSFCYVVLGFFRKIKQTRLYVAPARHRNTLIDGVYVSKHLDSLVRVYGEENALIWEAGPNPNAEEAPESLPRHVSVVATLLSRVVPIPANLEKIRTIVRDAVARYPVRIELDLSHMVYHLVAYDISRRYYCRIFKRSRLEVAYIVVYYSFRHAAIISALNDVGIQTAEYQHGIQNNIHPLYTHWENLKSVPQSLPGKVLVWDRVSQNRISAWATPLGISVEVVGNLWCLRSASQERSRALGQAVMVAVQIYTQNFNPEILKVIGETPDRQWIFREHPVYPIDQLNKAKLLEQFDNLEIVGAQDESVEDTLARCFCCITGFSTVGIEAMLYGRKTIFTHENARDGLSDYIDGDRCFYAETAEEISATLMLL